MTRGTTGVRLLLPHAQALLCATTVCIFSAPAKASPPDQAVLSRGETRNNTVAVLDFETPTDDTDVDNWAVGLSDFMLVALQERGITVLERQDLGYVLSERRLRNHGLSRPEDILRQKLPWVTYLLKGSIEPRDDGRFELAVALARTADGTEAAAFRSDGAYPDGVPAGIASLAEHIVAFVLAARPIASTRLAVQGFTRTPEIAMLFYRGVDHYASGRPEIAEEYFRLAAQRDPDFRIATLWRIKAYERLGLTDLARVVRREMQQDRGRTHRPGQNPTTAAASGQNRLVVDIRGDNSPQTSAFEQLLRHAFATDQRIRVFSPAWLKELVDEMDLSATGEFEPHTLLRRTWLPVDIVLLVHADPPGTDHAGRIEWLDGASGEILKSLALNADTGQWPSLCERLAIQLTIGDDPKANAPNASRQPLAPLDYAVKDPRNLWNRNYDLIEHAYYMRAFADDPADHVKLLHWYHALQMTLPWKSSTWPETSWPYLKPLINQLIDTIKPNEPHASDWLSFALWAEWRQGWLANSGYPGSTSPRAEDVFSPLLTRFPDSLAAFCARYTVAIEQISLGKEQEALATLEELVRRFEQDEDDRPLWERKYPLSSRQAINLYYSTIRQAIAAGKQAEVDRLVDRAYLILQRGTDTDQLLSDFNPTRPIPVSPALFGVMYRRAEPDANPWYIHDFILPSALYYHKAFAPRRNIGGHIIQLHSGRRATAIAPESCLDELLMQYHQSFEQGAKPENRYPAAKAYLRGIIDHLHARERLGDHFQNARHLIGQLPSWAGKDARCEAKQLITEFVNACNDAGPEQIEATNLLQLLLAHREYDEMLRHGDKLIQSDYMLYRCLGITTKSQILAYRQEHDNNSTFLLQELARLEHDLEPIEKRDFSLWARISLDTADAFRRTGDPKQVMEVLEQALAVTTRVRFDDRLIPGLRASLRYYIADMLVFSGDTVNGMALFREVAADTEGTNTGLLKGHDCYRLDISLGLSSAPPDLYTRTIARLEALRNDAAGRSREANVPKTMPTRRGHRSGRTAERWGAFYGVWIFLELSNELLLDVFCEYGGDLGHDVFVAAAPIAAGSPLPTHHAEPGIVRPGKQWVRVTLRMDCQQEEARTDQIRFTMYDQNEWMAEKDFEIPKTWCRPSSQSGALDLHPTTTRALHANETPGETHGNQDH